MASSFTIPSDYGYVLLSATLSTLLPIYHLLLTSRFRKAAQVPYPNAYAAASEASSSLPKYQFNCAQRAHSNFNENYPSFLVTLFVGGLAYPKVAAGFGAAWVVARYMYASGYVRAKMDGGRGRYNGGWWYGPGLGLLGLAGWSAYVVALG